MKISIQIAAALILALVCAKSVAADFTDVIEKDGQTLRMNYADAKAYCASKHKGLPTVRDFAKWSIERGSKGIMTEEQFARASQAERAGYYPVPSVYDDGSKDNFFFNHSGFLRPQGKMGSEMFWTLSTATQNPNYAHVFYGEFGGGGGRPEEHHKEYLNAVVCLK